MQLVKQTNRYNCGSACLAMLLGLKTVASAEKRLGRRVGTLRDPVKAEDDPEGVIGVTVWEIAALLWDQGYSPLQLAVPGTQPDHPDASWFDRVGDDLPAINALDRIVRHLQHGGVALLGVASRTREDGGHWIVAHGEKLFDPTKQRDLAYTNLRRDAPVEIHEALLIRDHPAARTSCANKAKRA